MILKKLANRFNYTELRELDVESPEFRQFHIEILADKKSIRKVFESNYRRCLALEQEWFSADGLRIELGSGTAFIKQLDPDVITTDMHPGPGIDRILDARAMDLADASVRTLIAFNVFHHLHDPEQFLKEVERVLKPGGGIILLEPYYGPVARQVFRHLFDQESFDMNQTTWTSSDQGLMKGANQALAYIVFKRDFEKYKNKYPKLEVVHKEVLDNYMSYLLSGGLNFRQLIPDRGLSLVRGVEKLIKPFRRYLGLHQFIVIRKSK